MGKRIAGPDASRRCGRCAATCRSCSRTRTARCRRACRSSDIIEEGLWIHMPQLSRHEREQRVIDGAGRTSASIPRRAHRYPHEFSGGQRQRIAIARAMVLEPTLRRARRADQRARHVIQAQIVDLLARPAEAARPHLPVHLPRPARGGGAVVEPDGDEGRQGGGGRPGGANVQVAEDRLHPRAVRRRLQSRSLARGAWSRNKARAMADRRSLPMPRPRSTLDRAAKIAAAASIAMSAIA